MSHYDCTDCGTSMGIAYGVCDKCTPQCVKDAQQAMLSAEAEAYKRYQATRCDEETKYVELSTLKENAHYNELYAKHKPK